MLCKLLGGFEVKWLLGQVVERGLMSSFVQAMAPRQPVDTWQLMDSWTPRVGMSWGDGIKSRDETWQSQSYGCVMFVPIRDHQTKEILHFIYKILVDSVASETYPSYVSKAFVSVIWDWMRMGRCDKTVWSCHVLMETYKVFSHVWPVTCYFFIVAESLESKTFSYDQSDGPLTWGSMKPSGWWCMGFLRNPAQW